MPPSSPAATTSEPDSGTGGTDLHMKTFSKREQGDADIYAHDMWALGFEEHFVHLR